MPDRSRERSPRFHPYAVQPGMQPAHPRAQRLVEPGGQRRPDRRREHGTAFALTPAPIPIQTQSAVRSRHGRDVGHAASAAQLRFAHAGPPLVIGRAEQSAVTTARRPRFFDAAHIVPYGLVGKIARALEPGHGPTAGQAVRRRSRKAHVRPALAPPRLEPGGAEIARRRHHADAHGRPDREQQRKRAGHVPAPEILRKSRQNQYDIVATFVEEGPRHGEQKAGEPIIGRRAVQAIQPVIGAWRQRRHDLQSAQRVRVPLVAGKSGRRAHVHTQCRGGHTHRFQVGGQIPPGDLSGLGHDGDRLTQPTALFRKSVQLRE